jgi:UDP-N-acetylglucosamine acyltransferase
MFQGGSRSSQDIPPYIMAGKEPIRYAGINIIGLRRRGYTNEQIDQIHETYRILYSKGVLAEGIAEVRRVMPSTPEINYILDFVEKSKRGIIR